MICLWQYTVLTIIVFSVVFFFSVFPIDCSVALSLELNKHKYNPEEYCVLCNSGFTSSMITMRFLLVTLYII
jgi:hypothetical protein